MTSSENARDYYYLRDPKQWGVSETNTAHLLRFINRKRGLGVGMNTINTYVGKTIGWIKRINEDDALNINQDQILEAYFQMQDLVAAGEYSPDTLNGDVIALKQFMQFLHGVKEGKQLVAIRRKRSYNQRLSSEYVTPAQIKDMRNYAESTGDIRGTALLMLTFGTGARLSEILDAKVKDLNIKQYNAVLNVDGKTGRRSIPFVIGMPEVILWLNSHPVKGSNGKVDPDAPLFVTHNTRGHGVRQLSDKRVEAYFAEVAKKVGIPDDVKSSPHAFRHVMATLMARKLTIKEMNLLFGWSPQSTTALTYIHTSQEDLEENILSINGITNPEEPKTEDEFVIQCPSCQKILAAGTQVCPRCRMILDPVLAVQFDSVVSDLGRREVLETYLKTQSR